MGEFRKEFQAFLMASGYWNMVTYEKERQEMVDNACNRLQETQEQHKG